MNSSDKHKLHNTDGFWEIQTLSKSNSLTFLYFLEKEYPTLLQSRINFSIPKKYIRVLFFSKTLLAAYPKRCKKMRIAVEIKSIEWSLQTHTHRGRQKLDFVKIYIYQIIFNHTLNGSGCPLFIFTSICIGLLWNFMLFHTIFTVYLFDRYWQLGLKVTSPF